MKPQQRGMLHSIVLPLDGTPFSEQAIPVAASIAGRAGADLQLVLVHIHASHDDAFATVTPHLYGGINGADPRHALEVHDGEWRYLANQADRIQEKFGASAHQTVMGGLVSDALAAHVRDSRADLVVMTTHARAGIARTWFGSVADDLLHRLHVPILLLHGQPTIRVPDRLGFRHVLIALDGSELAEQIIGPALALAALSDARVTLFTAITGVPVNDGPATDARPVRRSAETGQVQRGRTPMDYLEPIAEQVNRQGFDTQTTVYPCEHAADGIQTFAEAAGIDLIALATHGRGGLSRLLLGSVADAVLQRTTIPLLVCRPARESV